MSERLKTSWRKLEQASPLGMLALGLVAGSGAGAALFYSAGVGAPALGLLVLFAAAPLALRGRAVVAPLAPPPGAADGGAEPFSVMEEIAGLEMVVLPGGEFLMGSPDLDELAWRDERPQHRVAVAGYAIGRTPVTRGLWRDVLEEAPEEWGERDDRLPATDINWREAITFCNALSNRQGLEPCYRRRWGTWRWRRSADGYRLPTEAEWEYAARAGTTTRWSFGDDEAGLDHYAWHTGNSGNRVHPVGTKEPNPWGLYDLHGNVWEWCWGRPWPYASVSMVFKWGLLFAGLLGSRVNRGGSAWRGPRFLRSAARFWYHPEVRRDDLGFRCVRVPRRRP